MLAVMVMMSLIDECIDPLSLFLSDDMIQLRNATVSDFFQAMLFMLQRDGRRR